MKTCFAVIMAALSLATPAFSQSTWGSVGSLTVALTLSAEVPGLQLKDETGKVLSEADGGGPTFENTYSVETYSGEDLVKTVSTSEILSKIISVRWGNADILAYLVESGALTAKGTKAPFITGYSLVAVYDGEGGAPAIYAKHTDKTLVLIDAVELLLDFEIAAINAKTVVTDSTPVNGEPTTRESRTYSDTFKGMGTGTVASDIGPLTFKGLATGSYKLVTKTETLDGEKFTSYVFVPGAFKLDKVIGVAESDVGLLIEGSVSIGAGALTNLDLLFEF